MKMNNNQQNPVCIEAIVLKYFIRELKGRKMYYLLFREIPKASTFYYAVKRLLGSYGDGKKLDGFYKNNGESNPFKNAKTIQNIVDILVNLNSNISKYHGMGGARMQDEKSERVSMTINHLIHFILEHNGGNIDLFNSVGQSVFNNTCNYLWGAEYTKEQNRIESEQRQKLSTPDGVRSILWKEYMRRCADGFRASFDEFMALYESITEHLKNNGAQSDPYVAISLIPSVLNGRPNENINEILDDDFDFIDDYAEDEGEYNIGYDENEGIDIEYDEDEEGLDDEYDEDIDD